MRTLLFTSLLIFIGLILYSCSEDDKSVTPQQNPDPTIPIVNILSPTESDELIDSVNVIISATDDKGIIKVEFIVNNQVVKSWIHPPYSFKWDLTSNNDSTEISFFAKAYDADENISTTKVYHMTAWRLKSPTILTMEPVSSSSVKLIWNDNSTIETGYIIEQQVNSGIFSPIANTAANETSYVAINLDILNEYSFRVNAVRNNYSSDYTPEVSIRFDYELTSLRILTGHSYYIWSIVFSPDDNYIVSASADQTVKLWETATGSLIRTLSGHMNKVRSVAFSPDGNYIASGSYDQTVKLWETSTGNIIHSKLISSPVTTITYSSDGNYIASNSGNNRKDITLWQLYKNWILIL